MRFSTLSRIIAAEPSRVDWICLPVWWTLRSVNHYQLDVFARAEHAVGMKPFSNFVSLHPYFKAHPGKVEAAKAIFSLFVEKTAMEKDNLFYSFTVNGDEVFCREAYGSAEGLLAHLENVSAPLAEMLKVAELIRVEVHGPAEELEKLKAPLAHLNPAWFVLEAS